MDHDDLDSRTVSVNRVARRDSTDHEMDSGPGFPRDPEVHRNLCRRLAGLALIYAGTYGAVEVVTTLLTLSHRRHFEDAPSDLLWHILALVSVSAALAAAWLLRSGRVSRRSFPGMAVGVQVVGVLGIVGGYGDWPRWTVHGLEDLCRVLGADPATVVAALKAAMIEPIGLGGIAWAWVWMIIVPLVIPLSTRAVVVGSLLSVFTIPGMLVLGGVLNPVRPDLQRLVNEFNLHVTVTSLICGGLAIAGSRVVFRLTRELSRARRMGSYQLVEKIGEGGMGEVWRAEHRMLARPAAIKLIRGEFPEKGGSRSTALRRFEREAQVIATLSSPHTVSLYDFGVTDEGRFYYVMELLDGIDLKTLVESHGPQPAGRVRDFLIQACHSLADAHRAGVLHRDVKPGNLVACRLGGEVDFIKVLDFGLVKDIGSTSGGAHLTAEGVTTGTPGFMAPEMATGAPVDARTDLYALGCVGFWLLTGRLVFEGETPMAIIAKHVSEPPPVPSSLTELEVPESLDRLILACLEKDPRKRPADARELASRLRDEVGEDGWSVHRAEEWWDTRFPLRT